MSISFKKNPFFKSNTAWWRVGMGWGRGGTRKVGGWAWGGEGGDRNLAFEIGIKEFKCGAQNSYDPKVTYF